MNFQKKIRKLISAYAARNVNFDIYSKIENLNDDKYRLKVKMLQDTKVADIKKHLNDVRLHLKLEILDVVEEANAVYIIMEEERSPEENNLISLWRSPEYCDALKAKGLVCPIGLDQFGNPVIIDFMDNRTPHIVVSGTTGSGKSVALMCLLTTIISYHSPQKVSLLIGDKANDLSQFKDLPHLSYPLIEDFDTLLYVLLVLKDEMTRRINMKNTDEFSKLPIIVCMIDEFNSLISEAHDKSEMELAVNTIKQILRMGRHARIHFVLVAHNPTRVNMHVDISDIPVKMVFQVSNTNNSVTILGEGGAEKLRGNGDMLFKASGKIQHLQGAFISQEQIDDLLNYIRHHYGSSQRNQRTFYQHLNYRFTISDADLDRKAFEIQDEKQHFQTENSSHRKMNSNKERTFANIVSWTLNQDEVSVNLMADNFGISWRSANRYMEQLQESGIVSELDAKLPRKVLLHSIAKLPNDILELLQRNGLCELFDTNNSQPVFGAIVKSY